MSGRIAVVVLAVLTLALVLVSLAAPAPASAAQTVVSLEFDDGTADQLQARPILNKYGVKATFFVISGRIGTEPGFYLDWSHLQALHSDGNEIGGHTLNHINPSTLTPDQQRNEVCVDRQNLLAHGLDGRSLAYPGLPGVINRAIVQGCGYNSARHDGGIRSESTCRNCRLAESIPPANFYLTRTPDTLHANTSLATIQRYVTQAEDAGGGWVQIVMTRFCESCDPNWGFPPSRFDAFLAWLVPRAGRGTVVKTVKDVIGGAQQTAQNDTFPPVIAKLSLSRKRFRVASTPTPLAAQKARKAKTGTSFKYTLSEPASVAFTVHRARKGRKKAGSRCKPGARRGRRCTSYKTVGRFTRKAGTLRNSSPFSGRIGNRRLKVGRYRATAVATDAAGNRSKPKRVKFRIVRR